MRKTLIAAVAMAPLWFMASRSPAAATTTISNTQTTPVATATVNNGAPDDISIVSGGVVQPSGGGTTAATLNAVTLNSNNTVTNAGAINFSNANNVVGILVNGGFTGAVNNNGAITVNETFTPSDTNSDGSVEAPFVTPTSSSRYGIRVVGSSPFVGTILNGSGGAITVRGNDSFGISVEAQVSGSLLQEGSISYTGNGGAAINSTAAIGGDVLITGGVSAQGSTSAATGRNTSAISLGGDVGGRLSIYSTVSSTGYGLTTRQTTPQLVNTVQNTASELLQSGPAVVIGGNVAGGIFIGAPPTGTASGVTSDGDGDGLADSAEGSGSVTNFGSAPALLIGAAGRDVALGAVDPSGANGNGYGLVIRGTVDGEGVNDGVTANGVVVGVAGGTAHLAGGVRVVGSVDATAYGASATGLRIASGSVVPEVRVEGAVAATILSPNTVTNTIPAFSATGTAVQIDPGATVSTLTNSGTISASVTGDQSNVNAVVDQGGGITTVNNTGAIVASITPLATTDTVSGKAVALDLSANTTGTTLTQQQAPTQVVTSVTDNGVITVTTTTTPPVFPLTASTAAVSTTTTTGNTTIVTTVPASPSIVGAISLGSGSNTVNLLAGTIFGDLNLGSGPTASFTIDNGASYSGAVSYTGPALSVNVNNGTLLNTNPVTYRTSNLRVGSSGTLYFAVDPANARATEFLDFGPATIAAGAKFGLTVLSTAAGAQTYTLISSPQLSNGASDSTLAAEVPYLFNAALHTDETAGTLSLTISQKTPAQLGLNPSQGAALSALTTALPGDPVLQNVVLNQYTRAGFLGTYNQLLPDYAGGVFQAANAASLAISRATAEPTDITNPTGTRGAWAQEFFVGVNQGIGSTDGFRGGGFGFVGGLETGGSGLGAIGVTGAFVSNNTDDPHLAGDNQTSASFLQGGVYWQGETHGFTGDADVSAGYAFFDGRREFLAVDSTGTTVTVDRKNSSSWDGYTLSGRFGVAYDATLFGFSLRPQAHLDYFRLSENSYKENPLTGGPAFSLAIGDRTGQETSGTASLVFGRAYGRGLVWRPQVEFGVRDVFDGDAGSTTAQFLTGGPKFTLTPADVTGLGGLARFKVKADTEYYEVGFEAGGESRDRYLEGDVRFNVRVLF